ncbi:MAG: hypothetical protein JWN70_7096 [Planctomycetaceae bacterium]|nr:hypothetical protein [Planctomycetaceae bacterium]
MSIQRRVSVGGGYFLHLLIGGLMIFAGSGKVFGFSPPDVVQKMSEFGLSQQMQLIGWGELITAVLLLIPRTTSLGILLTSSFWGGVICIHMAHHVDYAFPSVLLALSWLGAWLRDPAIFRSFCGNCAVKGAT